MLELVELDHALFVFHARSLQFGYLLALELVDLSAQDDLRIFDDGLHQSEHVERVARAILRQTLHGIHHVQPQRLQQREIFL